MIQAQQAGLVGEQVASISLGYADNEYLTARVDHTARIARIAEAQSSAASAVGDPAARGLDDLSANTAGAGDEKMMSRNTDLQPSTAPRVRGEGLKGA